MLRPDILAIYIYIIGTYSSAQGAEHKSALYMSFAKNDNEITLYYCCYVHIAMTHRISFLIICSVLAFVLSLHYIKAIIALTLAGFFRSSADGGYTAERDFIHERERDWI